MLNLAETSDALVISYPIWLGLISVAGVALFAYAARPKAQVTRRWALLVVGAMLTWTGIYFATFRVTLTPESGRVYGFLAENERMDWAEARTAAVVMRNKGKGGPKQFMVVMDGSLREFEVPLGGLNDTERQRVVAYVYARMPR